MPALLAICTNFQQTSVFPSALSPQPSALFQAVYFLLRFPSSRPARTLSGIAPCEARTFLSGGEPPQRPPDPLNRDCTPDTAYPSNAAD